LGGLFSFYISFIFQVAESNSSFFVIVVEIFLSKFLFILLKLIFHLGILFSLIYSQIFGNNFLILSCSQFVLSIFQISSIQEIFSIALAAFIQSLI